MMFEISRFTAFNQRFVDGLVRIPSGQSPWRPFASGRRRIRDDRAIGDDAGVQTRQYPGLGKFGVHDSGFRQPAWRVVVEGIPDVRRVARDRRDRCQWPDLKLVFPGQSGRSGLSVWNRHHESAETNAVRANDGCRSGSGFVDLL